MTTSPNSQIVALLQALETDPSVPQSIKNQASLVLGELTGPVYQTDLWIYRGVVAILSLTIFMVILGGLLLAFKGDKASFSLPSEIVAIGSAAVGALAGLLAPSPQAPRG